MSKSLLRVAFWTAHIARSSLQTYYKSAVC